jgi:hypothetical protein
MYRENARIDAKPQGHDFSRQTPRLDFPHQFQRRLSEAPAWCIDLKDGSEALALAKLGRVRTMGDGVA